MLAEGRKQGLGRKHGIDHVDDGARVAPGHVLRQRLGVETGDEEIARHRKEARLGATKAVDRLLRIADQEDARTRGVRIRCQPGEQDLPLQGIGVLELVEQDVLVTRIQPRLQEGRRRLVAQKAQHRPFGVGEIDLPARALEGIDLGEEGGENAAGIGVERQDGLGQLRFAAGQQTCPELRVQIEEACRAGWRVARIERLAWLATAQRALLGEEHGLQRGKTCCGIERAVERAAQGLRALLVALQLAGFEQAEEGVKIRRPVAGKEGGERRAGCAGAKFDGQRGENGVGALE